MTRPALAIVALLALTGCSSDDAFSCPGHNVIEFDGRWIVEDAATGGDQYTGDLAGAEAFCANL